MKKILCKDDIVKENIRMFLENDTLVSLINYPKIISDDKLKTLINCDYIPHNVNDKNILLNRNLNINLEDIMILKGITIKNSILRHLPTNIACYSSKIIEENVATNLSAVEPLLILHTSLDNKWYYVQSYYYRGWIDKKDVLIINDEAFNHFINSKNFLIVTNKYIKINNIRLNMGVKIPYLLEHDNCYEVLIPTINGIKITSLDKLGVCKGYLPYTPLNVVKQALKYQNTRYSWGGTNSGIDCSLLIVNILKTFGLYVPRDTKEQEYTIGINRINLKGLTTNEKKKILNNLKYPFILYKPGHVLLCIYKNTVIHAYGKANKVIVSKIHNSYGDNLYPFLTSAISLYKKK